MHSSRRKDLIGTRKVGRYIGNLYCTYYDCQFKLSAEEKRNSSNFQNVDGFASAVDMLQVDNGVRHEKWQNTAGSLRALQSPT